MGRCGGGGVGGDDGAGGGGAGGAAAGVVDAESLLAAGAPLQDMFQLMTLELLTRRAGRRKRRDRGDGGRRAVARGRGRGHSRRVVARGRGRGCRAVARRVGLRLEVRDTKI